jgi:hypothetical protein
MSKLEDEPERVIPANQMSKDDAERLRALLRRTEPADLSDPSVLQRVGRVIAQAIAKPFKRHW